MTTAERRRPGKPSAASRPRTNQLRRQRATETDDFKTSMITVRVKARTKTDATAVLEQLGISLPEAIRVFLGRVVNEQAFPFPLVVPNRDTADALRDSLATDYDLSTTAGAMFDDLEKGHAE